MVALLLMARGGNKGKKGKKGAAVEVGQPAALTSGSSAGGGALAGRPEGSEIQPEVMNLVQRQPEEIAVLLRSWLADRR
jgi:flagellar biosynthesis/type III secretory pathway M-ring protein FliF/YscJ